MSSKIEKGSGHIMPSTEGLFRLIKNDIPPARKLIPRVVPHTLKRMTVGALFLKAPGLAFMHFGV